MRLEAWGRPHPSRRPRAGAVARSRRVMRAPQDEGGEISRTLIGRSVRRIEDARLLRGGGHFVDDFVLPRLLNACFVRSPVAHARLLGIDTRKARALPGVHAVLTYKDLRALMTCDRVPLALP